MAIQNIPIKLEAILTVTIDDSETVEQSRITESIAVGFLRALRSVGFVASVEVVNVTERRFPERSGSDN
jgi:hypothetical protein